MFSKLATKIKGLLATLFTSAALDFVPYWIILFIIVSALIAVVYIWLRKRKASTEADDDFATNDEITIDHTLEPKWLVDETSLRKTRIVRGEGPKVFYGYASVETNNENRYGRLFLVFVMDLEQNRSRYEFRIGSLYDTTVVRNCKVTGSPGEVPLFERNWPHNNEPFNNVLCTSDDAKMDSIELLKDSTGLTFVWMDQYKLTDEQENRKTHRVIVTTEGLAEAIDTISRQGSSLRMHGAFI